MKKIHFAIILSIIIIASCSQWSGMDLEGTWEATSILEEDQPLEVDYPSVKLDLKDDGTYEYTGTLNYREAGKWSTKSNYLYTIDTLIPDGAQKIVFIKSYSRDSLEIQMVQQEKVRILKMKRTGSN